MSLSYAVIVVVRCHLKLSCGFTSEERLNLDTKVLSRWSRIYSPVHALAFECDPLFKNFKSNISRIFGQETLELNQGEFPLQCRNALRLFAKSGRHEDELLREYMTIRATPPPHVFGEDVNAEEFLPIIFWSNVKETCPNLFEALSHVFRAPSSSAGVERNHKISKKVHRRERCRLGDGKVERQTFIAHNVNTMKRKGQARRSRFEVELSKNRLSRSGLS